MTSGRSVTARAAAPGADRSLASVATANGAPAGFSGATISLSITRSMARSFNALSRTSRPISLRPIMPAAPVMRMCIRLPLQRHAAVDQVGLASNVACLVGSQKERERSDFRRRPEAPHGLAIDEILANVADRFPGRLGQVLDPPVERGRRDRAGTDRVRPDALLDKIGGHRLGEPNDGGLGGAVDVAVGHRPDR